MIALLSKKEQIGSQFKNITEKTSQDFIPVVGHYDANTILDKNLNLMAVIEVPGFEPNDQEFQTQNLRKLVRDAMLESVDSYEIATYLHVIRDRRDIMPQSEEPFGFAAKLREAWCHKNNWDRQLVNTLYITVVIQGPPTPALSLKTMVFSLLKKQYETALSEKLAKLNQVTDMMISKLARFGARRLSIIQNENQCISEPLSLFYHLTHLYNKPINLPIRDFSEYLANMQMRYMFNNIEIEDADGTRYAAVYTIKETHNIPVSVYDQILQLGTQFIISECFYPTTSAEVTKQYATAMEMAEAGRNRKILVDNGIDEIMKAGKQDKMNYCSYQITITVYSDDVGFFQDKVQKLYNALSEMGLPFIREDFNMARCFWAQLPGNMKMLCRTRHGSMNRIGAFTSIHHKALGCYNGSKWGVPITLFRNLDGNPFYFNFHRGENGHTLIVGPKGTGKTMLTRFLITQACKLSPRIIYIDLEGGGENFLSEVGGMHLQVTLDEIFPVQIMPFNLALFGGKIELFKKWLMKALWLNESNIPKSFDDIVDEIHKEDLDPKAKYELFKTKVLESEDVQLKSGFEKFFGAPHYEHFFNDDILDVFELESIVSMDLSKITDSVFLELYLTLLLAKIPEGLEGRPTIIALNRAHALFTNGCFAPLMSKWLDTLTKKNAIALFSTHNTDELETSDALKESLPKFATRVFLSDRHADKYFRRAYQLSEWDQHKIKSYDVERRMFLLKQGDLTIIASANIDELPEIGGVLC